MRPPRTTSKIALVGWIWLVVGAVTPVLTPSPTRAETGDMKEAKRHFVEGKNLYEKGKFIKAAESFLTAYELSKRGELLYNIGQSYRKAGDLQNAEKYFQKYLNENPDANNEDEVVDRLIEIQQKLASRMATIDVQTRQDGWRVFVDDENEPRCASPCSISVAPGERTIRITGEGMEPYSESFTVEKTETRTVEATLEQDLAAGRLALRTDGGGGRIEISGAGRHSLPLADPLKLEPGDYQIEVIGADGGSWSGSITITSEETTRLLVPTSGNSGGPATRHAIAYGLAGTSAALLTGGILFGRSAKNTHDILAGQQARSGAVTPGLADQGRRQQRTANVLIGAGTTTLLTGAGLYLADLLAAGR